MIVRKNQIKCFIAICIFICMFTLGILVQYNYNDLAIKISIKPLIIVAFALIISLIQKKNSIDKSNLSTFFLLLCMAAALSGIIRGDLTCIIAPLLIYIAYTILKRRIGDIDTWFIPISVAYIVACVITILRLSISTTNSQGVVLAFLGIIVLNVLCYYKKDNLWMFCAIVVVVSLFLIMTKSRTSLMAFLVIAVITYKHLFLSRMSIRNLIIFIVLVAVLAFNMNSIEMLGESFFLNKWSGEADITSARLSLWTSTVSDMRLFGKGIDFLGIKSSQGLTFDAHNSIVQLIGCFGYVTIIPVIAFVISLVVRIKNSEKRILFLNFFVGWGIISMFESLELFTSRMIPMSMLFLIYLAMLTNDKHEY